MIKQKLKSLLDYYNVDFLLINATNKWLEEEAELEENSRYILTNFKGDIGDAIITNDYKIYLCVDGRYHIQAEQEAIKDVNIIKLQLGQKQDEELLKFITKNTTLGIFSKKNSVLRFEKIKSLLKDKQVKIKLLDNDIISDNQHKNNTANKLHNKTGCRPRKFINKKAIFITNLDEIAYLTQIRSFDKQYSSRIRGKLFIDKNRKQTFFFENDNTYEEFLKNFNEEIIIDKSTINVYDYNLIKKPINTKTNKISQLKYIKTKQEIEALKKAFEISDKSLLETREFINNSASNILTEEKIREQLEKNFYKNGAVGLSFKSIVAINKHSALPHYNKYATDTFLNNGDLVLIDCGIYTKEGLATDTTRVFVKGEPSSLQKNIYTLVLKAFLQAYMDTNKTMKELNQLAHNILDNQCKNFIFNHGLGHSIGISVHDTTPISRQNKTTKQKIKNNVCFTIEPGLYNKDLFGIRLENSFYRKNRKNISFTKIGFEKKLIDFSKLSQKEYSILHNDFKII